MKDICRFRRGEFVSVRCDLQGSGVAVKVEESCWELFGMIMRERDGAVDGYSFLDRGSRGRGRVAVVGLSSLLEGVKRWGRRSNYL